MRLCEAIPLKMRYPFRKQFGPYAKFTPPFSRACFRLAAWVQPLLPKGLHDRRVRVCAVTFGKDGNRSYLLEGRDCAKGAPCLVYFHGGGFVYGAARYHYENAKAYALGAECKVLFVNYPLAPYHPFPEPDEACLAAYRYACTHAEELGIDARRVAVGGDSAGGFLAAETALRAAAEGMRPCFALLVYPVIGGGKTASMRRFRDTPMWNARLNAKMWEYFGGGRDVLSDGLSVFPAAYVETAEFDCLHDEGVRFARALEREGVEVTLNRTRGTMHGFDIARKSDAAKQALAARIAALRTAFYGN